MMMFTIPGLLLVVACLATTTAHAQFGVPWRHAPTLVAISSAEDDPRLLVERAARKNAHELAGRTENNRWVNFAGPSTLINQFVDVVITELRAHTLRGRLLS